MGRVVIALWVLMIASFCTHAATNTRPLTLEEYELARTFRVGDMDHKSYLEIIDAYILDRYDMRTPYFISSEGGKRKRFDLYKYIDKANRQELGILIFCTNEKNQIFVNCLPNNEAGPDVWERFFQDISETESEEANYTLKLFYVLRKELGLNLFSLPKGQNDLICKSDVPPLTLMCVRERSTLLIHYAELSLRYIEAVSGDTLLTVDGIRVLDSIVEGEELRIINPNSEEVESHIVIHNASSTEIKNGDPFVRNNAPLEK